MSVGRRQVRRRRRRRQGARFRELAALRGPEGFGATPDVALVTALEIPELELPAESTAIFFGRALEVEEMVFLERPLADLFEGLWGRGGVRIEFTWDPFQSHKLA